MNFSMTHTNINVTDINRSVAFYEQALGLKTEHRIKPEDGSFEIVFLGDGTSGHQLELTWLSDHPQAYELGENENHLAFIAEDFDAACQLHRQMGCICYENTDMGIYFIEDPDGYWMEIIPKS